LPAFTASGKVTDADGYAFTGLKVAFTRTTISGDFNLTRGAERFKLQAKASSPLLDFTVLSVPRRRKTARNLLPPPRA
jgi:hypothetical protein